MTNQVDYDIFTAANEEEMVAAYVRTYGRSPSRRERQEMRREARALANVQLHKDETF